MEPLAVLDLPRDPLLDLPAYKGQRQASFRFYVTDIQSNAVLGEVTPIRDTCTLTHDTSRTIKRQLQISLGVHDTANIDPVSNRVSPYMVFPNGAEYPLGSYLYTVADQQQYTSGNLGTETLNDEMFAVDQQLRYGVNGFGKTPSQVIIDVLSGLGISTSIEASETVLTEGWGPGTTRGSIFDAITRSCDYFSPWFDNNNVLRFIRTFDPHDRLPDIDFDYGFKVDRNNIVKTGDLLTAPNTFIVVSNSGPQDTTTSTNDNFRVSSTQSQSPTPIVGTAFVPDSAPNSVARRGFEIVQSNTLQVNTLQQAQEAAVGIMRKASPAQRVTLTTPPDPRHDSYNVIKWEEDLWLELSWSMELREGGTMSHVLQKSYR